MERIKFEIFPILVVVVLGVWSVRPVFSSMAVVADYGTDGLLISWITNQTGQKVSGSFRNIYPRKFTIWDGNAFYPYSMVLGYSDLFVLSAFWSFVPVFLSGNPGVSAGVGLLVGQLLTGMVVYWWWKEMTGNKWAAVLAAVALEWAQFRWQYQVHLQMWNMQYCLLAAFGYWLWMRTGKWRWGILGGVFWGLQAWESVLPVYFVGLVVGAIMVVNKKFVQSNFKKILMTGLLAIVIMAPVLIMYAGISREFNYQRSIREAANNGVSVDNIWRDFGSGGILLLLILAMTRYKRESVGNDAKWLLIVGSLSLVMALGPTLKWQGKTVKIGGKVPVPLPYAILYYTVPGFGALRTPSRWLFLTGWAATGLIAMQLRSAKSNKRYWWGIAGALVVAILGGVSLTQYRYLPEPKDYPMVYKWIRTQPGKLVLELPAGIEPIEHERMLYSIWSKKTLVNGSSGFNPPISNEVKPDYVIVHLDQCQEYKAECLIKDGQVAWKDLNTVVYKL